MNYKLVKVLNPETAFHWIIVQNSPDFELGNDLAMDDPRFEIIKGLILTQSERECSFYRSIHHAKALNMALAYTDADLILVLDPDCFVLMPNWIDLVLRHMQTESLVFFGSPYHPRYYTHYRDFPNAICMFINRRLMQEKNYFTLDFMPMFEGNILLNKAQFKAIEHHSSLKGLIQLFSSSYRMFPLDIKDLYLVMQKFIKKNFYKLLTTYRRQCFERGFDQLNVRRCRDTGYKIYKCYKSLLKYQTLEIYALDPRKSLTKWCESILPDRFRTFPRNTSKITKTASSLFIELSSHGEQFFWNSQLFAFHFKGVSDNLSQDDKNLLYSRMLKIIENYFAKQNPHRIPIQF